MASCSLYTPGAKESLLIPKQELDNLLVFERIDAEVEPFVDRIISRFKLLLKGDWVREIHWYTSNTKKGKHYVIFRCSCYEYLPLRYEVILLF